MVSRTSLLAATVLFAAASSAQNYPSRPIRIVTSEPGGGADFGARLIAPALIANLGQPVIVENRPAGITQVEPVAKAAPDGYVLLMISNTFWTAPLLQSLPYDAVRDFSPVALTSRAPNILVVHPLVAANSVKELIALAKARPGALNYASTPAGATNHLAAELFKFMAGVNIVRVPYKATGPQLVAVVGGEVQLGFASGGAVAPHIRSGRLRGLAVTSARPSELVPDLPTVAASGLPGFESEVITSIFVPARTPAAIVNQLSQEIARFFRTPETRERLLNAGTEAVGSSPEELAVTMKAEIARMDKLIKAVGIRAD